MEKDELDAMLERDVAYLQRNIPPDDIYLFAQNTLLATYLLAYEVGRIVGIGGFEKLPKITQKCLKNISWFKHNQEAGTDVEIDLNTNGLV
jgi:hypothetical protein